MNGTAWEEMMGAGNVYIMTPLIKLWKPLINDSIFRVNMSGDFVTKIIYGGG